MTQHGGPSNREVHDLVTRKQPSINSITLEKRLVLYSAPTTSDSPVEWPVLRHPRQSYSAAGYPAESSNRSPRFDVSDARLRGVSACHPWSLYLPAILVTLPGDLIKDLRSASKPASVTKITSTWSAPERTIQEQPVRQRLPPRKHTFTPSIHCFGGPPKPAVSQLVPPKKPRHPTSWIEKFTIEGRLLLYAGLTPPGQPVKWIVQFRPRSRDHLTRQGDESSSRQREFVDGGLLNLFLRESLAYPPSVIYVPDILLEVSGGTVKQSNHLAGPNDLLDLIITATSLPPSAPYTPDVTATVDYSAPSIDIVAAFVQPEGSAEPEALVALGSHEDRSLAERVDEPIPANTEETAENSRELLDHTDSHMTESREVEPFTPISQPPTSSNHTSHDAISDDFIREQKAAVLHELRLLFAFLEERTGRLPAQTAWENTWAEVREQAKGEEAPVEEDVQHDMAEEAPVNEDVQQDNSGEAIVEEDIQQDKADKAPAEDVQQEEMHQRRKRRGGKRNTAWKNKRRQEKEDNERDSQAGPSGLR